MGIEKIGMKFVANEFTKSAGKVSQKVLKENLKKNFIKKFPKPKTPMQKLAKAVRNMEGTGGTMNLTRVQLRFLPDGLSQMLQPILKGAKKPVATVTYKVKNGFGIAGVTVKDGEKVIGTAAASVQNAGKANAVVKGRVFIPNKGKPIYAHGFADASKPIDQYNVAAGFTRRNGNVSAMVQTNAIGGGVQGEEKAIGKLLCGMGKNPGYAQKQYANILEKISKSANGLSEKLKHILT